MHRWKKTTVIEKYVSVATMQSCQRVQDLVVCRTITPEHRYRGTKNVPQKRLCSLRSVEHRALQMAQRVRQQDLQCQTRGADIREDWLFPKVEQSLELLVSDKDE